MIKACTSLTDTEALAKAHIEDPQLASLKLQLQNGTALHNYPTGLCKCIYASCRMDLLVEHTRILLHNWNTYASSYFGYFEECSTSGGAQ